MSIARSSLRRGLIAVAMGVVIISSLIGLSLPSNAAAGASVSAPQNSFADIFEKVSPAVVNISITKKADVRPLSGRFGPPSMPFQNGPLDDFFGRFFDMPESPPSAVPARALGSGLIVESDGYVVTNNHVVEGADSIAVTLADGREFDAKLVGTDPKTDLALLKVSADKPLPSVQLGNSEAVRVGDWVLAIGNPFGLGGTATFGIISAIGRDIQSGPYDNYLQIDAPINSGNSGGPVFNVDGEVIGVNTAIFSPNGGNVGIGFAIPAAQVQKVTAELKTNGHVTRGWLGVQIQEIDEDLADNLGVAVDSGVLVADVVDDSPAERGDIKVGDVITKFNGEAVDSPKKLSQLVADTDPTNTARLTVLRDGRTRNLKVKLGEADSSVMADAGGYEHDRANPSVASELGMTLAPLTRSAQQQLGVGEDVSGLVVTAVKPESVAAEKGIRRGDVILSVDGHQVSTLTDFQSAVEADEASDKAVRLLVRRGDGQRFVALGRLS